MTPEIPVGSVVVVKPVDPGTLRVGDIATYQVAPDKQAYITHRIVEIDRTSSPVQFTFKGDANRGPDLNPIPAGAIRGEVWFHVPYLGAIRDALHGKGGISLVAMLVLAGYAMTQLSGAFKELRKRPDDAGSGRRQARGAGGASRPARSNGDVAELPYPTDCSDRLQHRTEAAHSWQGVILCANGDTFTLLLAPPLHGVAAARELLLEAGAEIETWEPQLP